MLKTNAALDFLGSVKKVNDLSCNEITKFLKYASDNQSNTIDEASLFLFKKFNWDVKNSERFEEFCSSWKEVRNRLQLGLPDIASPVQIKIEDKEDDIPVMIKSGLLNKHLLVCEVEDNVLDFTGDSGAIGRMNCRENNGIMLDLIGRQYNGTIQSGPTLLFMQMSHVSDPTDSNKLRQIAKVEGISNEYCKLSFERDILGNMFGTYANDAADDESIEGEVDYERNSEDEEEENSNKRSKSAKKRKIKYNEDSDSDVEMETKKEVKKKKTSTNIMQKIKKATSFNVSKGKGKSKSSKKKA